MSICLSSIQDLIFFGNRVDIKQIDLFGVFVCCLSNRMLAATFFCSHPKIESDALPAAEGPVLKDAEDSPDVHDAGSLVGSCMDTS